MIYSQITLALLDTGALRSRRTSHTRPLARFGFCAPPRHRQRSASRYRPISSPHVIQTAVCGKSDRFLLHCGVDRDLREA